MDAFTIEMSVKKVCKGSIRYDSGARDSLVTSVYVGKEAFGGDPHPDAITVTVAAAGKATGD